MITIDFTTKSEITHEYIVDGLGNKRTCDENGNYHSYNDNPSIMEL